MTDEELIDRLKERNALIVHCSRPGKGDVGADGLLFPETSATRSTSARMSAAN